MFVLHKTEFKEAKNTEKLTKIQKSCSQGIKKLNNPEHIVSKITNVQL